MSLCLFMLQLTLLMSARCQYDGPIVPSAGPYELLFRLGTSPDIILPACSLYVKYIRYNRLYRRTSPHTDCLATSVQCGKCSYLLWTLIALYIVFMVCVVVMGSYLFID